MNPLIISFLVFAALFLVGKQLLTGGTPGPAKRRLASLRDRHPGAEEAEDEAGGDRAAGNHLLALAGAMTRGLEEKLVRAGRPVSLRAFLLIWFALGIGLPLPFLVLLAASGAPLGGTQLVSVVALVLLVLMLPRTWLNARIRTRQARVQRSLPDAIDLVTTCVEAGLGLDAALTKVASKIEDPLGEELSATLHEVSMGRLRRDALQDLAARLEVPELTSFVTAVVRAEQLGVGIGQVLRVQAQQLRTKRRQRAEEKAHKAAVKMMFPLVGFILPAMLMIVLGPAAISFIRQFSSG